MYRIRRPAARHLRRDVLHPARLQRRQADGIELAGTFVATVNADLRVGTLQETVTVTGDSPIVDMQNTTQQRVFDQEVIEAIPAGRSHINMAVLIPGLAASQPGRGALQDVGGTNNLQNTTFVIHGSKQGDTRLQLDGVRVGNVLSEGQFSNFVPDTGSTQEVTMDYAAVSAEQPFGGLRINIIPKEGGNALRGSSSPPASPRRGRAPTSTTTSRRRGCRTRTDEEGLRHQPVGGRAADARQAVVLLLGALAEERELRRRPLREPERRRPHQVAAGSGPVEARRVPRRSEGREPAPHLAAGGRGTSCRSSTTTRARIWDDSRPTISPESTVAYRFPVLNLAQAAWTSTMTNKLLVEARFGNRGEAFGNQYPEEGEHLPRADPGHRADQQPAVPRQGRRRRLERALRLQHAEDQHAHRRRCPTSPASHSLKVGATDTWALTRSSSKTNTSALLYRFTSGVPTQFTQYAPVEGGTGSKVIGEIGLFVQDRWTINRLTLNARLALRPVHRRLPGADARARRSTSRPATTSSTPSRGTTSRTSRRALPLAYDLFGNGKTALKVNVGKYVMATTPIGNPAGITTQATRSWNDMAYPVGDPRRGNYVVDCDLVSMAANGRVRRGPGQLRCAVVDPRVQRATRASAGATVRGTRSSRPACSTS